jgi:cytochrome c oxidase subunit 2
MRLASSSAKVYFDTGEAALDAASRKTITDVASTARASGSTIALTGYTDQTGNVDQNLALAKSRANAVHDALMAEGLPESNIVMKSPEFVTGAGSNAEARRVDVVRAPESPTGR